MPSNFRWDGTPRARTATEVERQQHERRAAIEARMLEMQARMVTASNPCRDTQISQYQREYERQMGTRRSAVVPEVRVRNYQPSDPVQYTMPYEYETAIDPVSHDTIRVRTPTQFAPTWHMGTHSCSTCGGTILQLSDGRSAPLGCCCDHARRGYLQEIWDAKYGAVSYSTAATGIRESIDTDILNEIRDVLGDQPVPPPEEFYGTTSATPTGTISSDNWRAWLDE